MTKTVCDICGKHDRLMRHCSLPMYRKYEITSCGKVFEEFTQVECIEADLCNEHWIMLADNSTGGKSISANENSYG